MDKLALLTQLDMNLNKVWEIVRNSGAWQAAVHGVARGGQDLVTEHQQQTRHVSLFIFQFSTM